MEEVRFNLIFTLFRQLKMKQWLVRLHGYRLFLHFFTCLVPFVLIACASSDVSRDVSNNTAQGIQHTKQVVSNLSEGNILDTYSNTSQTTKGLMIGGAVGALTGAFYPSVGILPLTVTGMIFGASYGSYIDANMTLADQLINRGISVQILGDQITLIIPSFIIFKDGTAKMKPQSYETLYLVTYFINHYLSMLVKINAHAYVARDCLTNLVLSEAQAARVSRFLQAAGVNSRVLYPSGKGAAFPVREDNKFKPTSENNRIEIIFEKLPM